MLILCLSFNPLIFCDKYYFCDCVYISPLRINYYHNATIIYFNAKEYNKCIYYCEKMKELESKRIAKAEEVLEYLTRVLRGEETEQVVVTENIGDFMSEAKVVDKEISAKDKIKAAELLGKRYRLFVDKVEKDSNVNVNSTTKLDSILNQLKDDDDE